MTMTRPSVFDEYEDNKGAVDTANNRRDNMISYHDVLKTHRWQMRCLSFFLAQAGANASSAFKAFSNDGSETHHHEFR